MIRVYETKNGDCMIKTEKGIIRMPSGHRFLKKFIEGLKTDLHPERLIEILYDSQKRIEYFSDIENLKEKRDVLESIYPEEYASALYEYLNKSKLKELSDVEKDILYKILKLPICSKLAISTDRIKNELYLSIKDNPSLMEVVAIISGYFLHIMDNVKENDNHLTLKELSYRSNFYQPLSILLVGEPGCGKSWIGQEIAYLLGVPCISIDCSSSDHLGIAGSASNWSGSKEGIITKKMIEENKIPFIVIFDEVDKTGHSNEHWLIDTINHIIDPAKTFNDPYLNLPLYHLKGCVFILTANDEKSIPDYIRSRVYTIPVEPLKGKVLGKYVFRKFIEALEKLSPELSNSLARSEEIREIIEEKAEKNKYDFRSMEIMLKTIFYKYKSPFNRENKIDAFFIKELQKETKMEKSTKKPRLGFMPNKV